MANYLIIREKTFVSRGTVIKRETSIYDSFGKLSDAEYVMEKLYKMYNIQKSHQLDDRIKSLSFRDKHLVVTIDNSNFKPVETRLYYICKRMI